MGKICLGNRDNGGKVTITEMDPEYMAGYQPGHKTDSEPPKGDTAVNDPVNHPKHYCRESGMESIEEMVVVFGYKAVMNFCLCNVWKYRYRASDKNGAQDLAKSDWYMRKYIELKEKEEEELWHACLKQSSTIQA